jgi:hypothetical protein
MPAVGRHQLVAHAKIDRIRVSVVVASQNGWWPVASMTPRPASVTVTMVRAAVPDERGDRLGPRAARSRGVRGTDPVAYRTVNRIDLSTSARLGRLVPGPERALRGFADLSEHVF